MRIGANWFGCFFALFLAFIPRAHSETITLPAVADTTLFEPEPDLNFGAHPDLPSGTLGAFASEMRSRMLIRFDLAGNIPSDAVIESAALHLTVTKEPDGGEESTFGIHRVLRAWSEGGKSGPLPGGAAATAGEATWNAARFPDDLWTQPGGASGVDYVQAASSSERVRARGEYQFEFGSSQVGELMEWLQQPETNFGWILITESEDVGRTARRFAAREYELETARPRLVIVYTVPNSPVTPIITGIALGPEESVLVTFEARAGYRYRLEFTNDLPPAAWLQATDLVLAETAGLMTLEDSSVQGSHRFYRIRMEEAME